MISFVITVIEAVRRELRRRQRQELNRSLQSPHPDASETAEAGFEEWAAGLPEEKATNLVNVRTGHPVRWVPGRGWVEGK